MKRQQENLTTRKSKVVQENNKRNLSRLNKRSYFGIGVEIKQYQDFIFNTFYDKEKFEELVLSPTQTENLNDNFKKYLNSLNVNFADLIEKAKEFFIDSFNKGGRRVYDREGNALRFDEQMDTRGAEFLLNQQEVYFKNLNEAQTKTVLRQINLGQEKGLPVKEIAENIQKSVEGVTKARATTIARTELVKSHNMGQVQLMKELDVETYNYITANDNKVSKICKKHQGNSSRPRVYELKNAGNPFNPLPVINSHPNCRCSVVVHKFKGENK